MTSRICLHSENDSFSLSNFKEVVSVSCYKQEKFFVVSVSNYSKTRGANQTKNALMLRFSADTWTQENAIRLQLRSKRGEAFVDVKFLHEVSQRKYIFLLEAEGRVMMTCRWFVCYIWIKSAVQGRKPASDSVQTVKIYKTKTHLHFLYLLPWDHHYNQIRLAVRVLCPLLALSFFPNVTLELTLHNSCSTM